MSTRTLIAALALVLIAAPAAAQVPAPHYNMWLAGPAVGFEATYPGESETWMALVEQKCDFPVARYPTVTVDVEVFVPDGFAAHAPEAITMPALTCNGDDASVLHEFAFRVEVLDNATKQNIYGILILSPGSGGLGYSEPDAISRMFALRSEPLPEGADSPSTEGSAEADSSSGAAALALWSLGLLGPAALALLRRR